MNIFMLLIAANYVSMGHCYLYIVIHGVHASAFPEDIQVTIVQRNNQGIILYSRDLEENFINVKLIRNSTGTVLLSSQSKYDTKTTPLSEFCHCSSCEDIGLIFTLQNKNGTLFLYCNNVGPMTLKIISKNEYFNDRSTPFQIFFGNNKSKVNKNDPDNLIGCLVSFHYKSVEMEFKNPNSQDFTKCNILCTAHTCNYGICNENYIGTPTCNCSLSIYNGPYCNESMFLNGNTILIWDPNTTLRALKLSWNSNQTTFILLEMHMSDTIYKIYVKNFTEIFISNGTNDLRLNKDGNYTTSMIVNIEVTGNLLIFKHNRDYLTYYSKNGEILFENVHIGFGEPMSGIPYFKGQIDLVYQNSSFNSPWIRPIFKVISIQSLVLRNADILIIAILSCTIFCILLLNITSLAVCIFKSYKGTRIDLVVKEHELYCVRGDATPRDSDLYEKLEDEATYTLESLSEDNAYMAMSPTLPERRHINLEEDNYVNI